MSDEKTVEMLVAIDHELNKIETTIGQLNSKLDRVIDMLEKSADRTDAQDRHARVAGALRTQSPSIVSSNQDVPLIYRVIKSSLPDVSGCNVVQFYGPDLQDTKFVADCVFHYIGSAGISTEFATPNDYDVAMEKFGNELDPFGRRARESGYPSHIVVGWDSWVVGVFAEVSIRVHRVSGGPLLWASIRNKQLMSGQIQIGPA